MSNIFSLNSDDVKCAQSKNVFKKLLDEKLKELKKDNINQNCEPNYAILKTELGDIFAVTISTETRLHKKNKLFKTGYRSNRISYPLKILEDERLIKLYLHTTASNFVKQNFTALRAYTLHNEKLEGIGRMFYCVEQKGKTKIGYIDDLYVKENEKTDVSFRGKGIATSLVKFAHIMMNEKGALKCYVDVKKIDKSFNVGSEIIINYDPITPVYKIFKKLGYKHEKESVFQDKYATNTPMVASIPEVINNINQKKVIIPKNDFFKEKQISITK